MGRTAGSGSPGLWLWLCGPGPCRPGKQGGQGALSPCLASPARAVCSSTGIFRESLQRTVHLVYKEVLLAEGVPSPRGVRVIWTWVEIPFFLFF